MIIDTGSWHYRWLAKRWHRDPNNLCAYFWKIVFSCFWYPAVFIVMAVVAVAVASAIALVAAYPILKYWLGEDLVVAIMSALFWIWFVLFPGHFLLHELFPNAKDLRRQKRSDNKSHLVRDYIRAKKDKVCPRLEYR